MSSNGCVSVMENTVSVGVHSLSECLCGFPYVLNTAPQACNEVNYIEGGTGKVSMYVKISFVC